MEPIGGSGPGNKLRMLGLHRSFEFDSLVALDCDTAIVETSLRTFRRRESAPSPSMQIHCRRRTGIASGVRSVWTHRLPGSEQPPRGEEIPACYNSGVLTVPGALCEQFEWSGARSTRTFSRRLERARR